LGHTDGSRTKLVKIHLEMKPLNLQNHKDISQTSALHHRQEPSLKGKREPTELIISSIFESFIASVAFFKRA
jgi:hypothetical protein